jgi:hypothetical protein
MANAQFRPLQVSQQGKDFTFLLRYFPQHFDCTGMGSVVTVRKINARNGHTGMEHAPDGFRPGRSGANGGYYFRA